MDTVSLPFLIISARVFVMFLMEVNECHFESPKVLSFCGGIINRARLSFSRWTFLM
jgi:hypothetical protein